MTDKRERLIQIVARTSLENCPEAPITLSSGETSEHYVDCKRALSHAETRQLLGELMLDAADAAGLEFDGVGGLELGAYPIGVSVSDAAARKGMELSAFIVRKAAKGHGLKKLVEGDLRGVRRVLIVDDAVTSGGSVIDAIRACKNEGFEVVGAIVIVDREQDNGRRNIENEGVEFSAIMTLKDLIDAP